MLSSQKKEIVKSIHEIFTTSNAVILAHYQGLTVEEITALRKKMRAVGVRFKVTKNSLARIALKGSQFEGLAEQFTGPTAIAYGADPVSAAKSMVDFAKDNEKLKLLGGALDTEIISVENVSYLASLPSLDALRAKIIGVLNAPASRMVGVLQAPAAQIARVLNAHASSNNT